jgi:ubiquinone/menaquinone biosynthesis C-methylase UbiE
MNNNDRKEYDWGGDDYQEQLEESRQDLWNPHYIEFIAKRAGMKPGVKLLDVGSGIGYLADTFAPFIEPDGIYIGVDGDERLVRRCVDEGVEGREYILGDALKLPLRDNAVDVVICQTLLMHLEEPEVALAEMKRVVKVGGCVVALEPDNMDYLTMGYNTHQLSIEDLVKSVHSRLLVEKGRKMTYGGDFSFGSKVPIFFNDVGLTKIEVYRTDKVQYLFPPYDTQEKKKRIEKIKYYLKNGEKYLKEGKEYMIKAGATEEEVKWSVEFWREYRMRYIEKLENEEFAYVQPINIYIVIGRKL